MQAKKNKILETYEQKFSEGEIKIRLDTWKAVLEKSIKNGWSNDARQYFIGKRMLKELQGWLFGGKNILLWEHIINSDQPECVEACSELRMILDEI